MPFHPGWSEPVESFGYGGYYVGDSRCGLVDHQQDSRILRQENLMVRNPKSDGLVSLEVAATPGRWHEQEALKDGPSADQLESSQGRTGLRSKSSANGEVKPDTEKSPEEVAADQNRVPEVKAETRIEAETSSR
jgi:hypothetical protein